MQGYLHNTGYSTKITHYALIVAVLWTALVASSMVWNFFQIKQQTAETALTQARYSLKKDIAFRRWNAMHGRVYVPITEATPPNPYLADIPDRDIKTSSGMRLTMINPAYMTRQSFDLMKKDYGILGHMTSLHPIRPENGPDTWEREALKSFEQGKKEFISITKIDGRVYIRLMEPFITEKACLKCHAKQGYKEGDIRGGINVSIPMQPLYVIEHNNIIRLLRVHLLLWFIGLGGITSGTFLILRKENERRITEKTLQSSEEKYRSIFENAVEGMFQATPEGHFISVNPAMARIYGYESPEEMVASINNIGRQLHVKSEDSVRFSKMLREDGKVQNFETQIRKKDGTVIWTSINSHLVKDAAGNTLYFEGIVEDVSARKEAEEKLIKYTEEIADLYNNAPCGYHSLDKEGTFLNINDTELKWLGYVHNEITGKMKFSDLLTPDGLKEFDINFTVLQEQGWIKDLEYDLIRRDGTILPVLLNATAIKDKDGNHIMSRETIFDITELNRAEKELQQLNETLEQRVEARTEDMKQARRVALSMMQDAEKERERTREALEKVRESSEQLKVLSSAVEQSPSSVMITDRAGLIEYVNPKFERLTGYNAGEAMGKTPRMLKSGVHDDKFYEDLWETILSGKEWHGEICNKKKSGELYWEQTSVSAVQNESGDISYFISVREDITERKRLDEELKERMEELERFSRLTINREEKMIQLKEEINTLLEQMNRDKKYKIVT
jgi:PAS domain S-box-containing protein